MRKKQWFTIVMAVLAVIGWTLHWHLTVNTAKFVRPPTALQQDGYLSAVECSTIQTGITESDFVAGYGLPHGDDQANGSSDLYLAYPLIENHDKNCTVTFSLSSHKIYEVALDLTNDPNII